MKTACLRMRFIYGLLAVGACMGASAKAVDLGSYQISYSITENTASSFAFGEGEAVEIDGASHGSITGAGSYVFSGTDTSYSDSWEVAANHNALTSSNTAVYGDQISCTVFNSGTIPVLVSLDDMLRTNEPGIQFGEGNPPLMTTPDPALIVTMKASYTLGSAASSVSVAGNGSPAINSDFSWDFTVAPGGTLSLTQKSSTQWGHYNGQGTLSVQPMPSAGNNQTLSNGWINQDIGYTQVAGSIAIEPSPTASTDRWTVEELSNDIWTTEDNFNYTYQSVSGNSSITARVLGIDTISGIAPNVWAKAGLMVRTTLDPTSPHYLLAATPGNGITYHYRLVPGGISTETSTGAASIGAGTPYSPPPTPGNPNMSLWLRLDVTDSVAYAWISSDGVNWQLQGSEAIPLGTTYYVGIANSAHIPPVYSSHVGGPTAPSNANLTTRAYFENVSLTGDAVPLLPSPWQNTDLGAPSRSGASLYLLPLYSLPIYSIYGSGADVWGTADQAQFAYQTLTGDGQIVAHMISQQNTNAWAKAGVMFRSGLDAGASHAFMAASPGNGIAFLRRSTENGSSVTSNAGTLAGGTWLKLQRLGSLLLASQSPDGDAWTVTGVDRIDLGSSVYAGLAVTSHNPSAWSQANFDSVALASIASGGALPSPWVNADIGSPLLTGGAQYSDGDITAIGAGADIWSTSDAFNFTSQPFNGNGEIISHVAGPINTSAWTKAGIMLREDLTASSRHTLVAVTAQTGVVFLDRPATGSVSVTTPNNTLVGPGWLKLQRVGNVFTGYWMADGSTSWQVIGSATIPMGTSIYAGLAITSHNVNAVTAATYSNMYVGGILDGTGGTIPDDWQIDNFGKIVSPSFVTLSGLTALQAYQLGVDPNGGTIDSNGISYAWEAAHFGYINVVADADPNGDGITNFTSYLLGIDPLASAGVVDSDGDGVPDSRDAYPTDPTRWLNLTNDPSDHVAPVITLDTPAGAVLIP